MKENGIIKIIIIILIICITVVLGFLAYSLLGDTLRVGNQNIEKEEQIVNIVQPSTNVTTNEQLENQTIIEPIITPADNETVENESTVSSYYYSQLDETAKEIYNGLKENKENLISGNYIINYDTKFNTLLNSDGGEEKFNQAFQSAWNAFSYDNVDLFYINVTKITLTSNIYSLGGIKTYEVSIGPGDNSNYFLDSFKSVEEVKSDKNYLENIKNQMIEQTSSDDTYTKIAKVHNWLIYFVNYENNVTSKDQHTIYGALKNGKAVCEGYARAFKYLMDGVGVPCVLASGTGQNSQGQTESHAWNYVQIEDKWYAVDVTWDDPVVSGGGEQTREMKNKYFLKGSEEFLKDHTEDGKLSENSMDFKFPTLSKENYTR